MCQLSTVVHVTSLGNVFPTFYVNFEGSGATFYSQIEDLGLVPRVPLVRLRLTLCFLIMLSTLRGGSRPTLGLLAKSDIYCFNFNGWKESGWSSEARHYIRYSA